MDKGEIRRTIRMDEPHWQRLTVLAQALVQPSEMPLGSRPGDNRVAQLFRLVSDGQIVLTRLGREAPEEG